MDRQMIAKVFNNLESNEQKLQINQRVKERIEELSQQLSSGLESLENKKSIELELEILKKIQMPQSLEKILVKEQDEIELDLQSIISKMYEDTKLVEGFIVRLNDLEQKSQTDLEVRKELMLHQLYSWIKENSTYNNSPVATYNGYSKANEKPSFDKMLQGLLEGEIDSYKNQANIQMLKNCLEDGSIEVLPPQYVESVVRKLISLNQITSEDRGCLKYYNQIINNQPVQTIPRLPYQVFSQITDYVEILPNELFNLSSNNSDIFRYGVAPGSSQYLKQLEMIKQNLAQRYQDTKKDYEDLQNMLNSGNIEFYYEFFIKYLPMDDLYKISVYNTNLKQIEDHTQIERLSNESLSAVKEQFSQEELQNIGNVFDKNQGLFQVVNEKNALEHELTILTSDLEDKCKDFNFLFSYLFDGKGFNEFSSINLEEVFYQYYQSKNGEELDPNLLQKVEMIKNKNPKMFDQIFQEYVSSNFIKLYQELQMQKNELNVEQSKEVKGGFLNFGKAKAEEDKKMKLEQIQQKLAQTQEKLQQLKQQTRSKMMSKLKAQYEEIKQIIPSAAMYCSVSGDTKEIDFSQIDLNLSNIETDYYTNINEQLVENQRNKIIQAQRENKGKYYKMCENKPEVIKYIEMSSRPSIPIVKSLASGTYEANILENDCIESIKENIVQQSALQI